MVLLENLLLLGYALHYFKFLALVFHVRVIKKRLQHRCQEWRLQDLFSSLLKHDQLAQTLESI